MIHLYALVPRAVTSPLVGVDDAVVEDVACDRLHAVVSDHRDTPATTRDNALRHASVVGAVADLLPTVPVRFGVVHTDRGSLRTAVRRREAELLACLARVGEAVEYVVRATEPPRAPATVAAPPSDGRAYMEARLAEQRATASAAAAVRATLAEATADLRTLVVEARDRDGPVGPERCFLVERSRIGDFEAAARRAVGSQDRLLMGGPWPPFTFADTGG